MNQLEIIFAKTSSRRWEHLLAERLRTAGYGVATRAQEVRDSDNDRALDRALALGGRRAGVSIAARAEPLPDQPSAAADLVIDLTGVSSGSASPTLRVEFMGHARFADGVAEMLRTSTPPELIARIDGVAVGRAAPMLEDRVWIGRIANSILPAATSLVLQVVSDFFEDRLRPIEAPAATIGPAPGLMGAYLPHLARGLAHRIRGRISRGREGHWQVAYRQSAGEGVAETGRLDGAPFTVLPDDGKRFYADPFLLARDGRTWLFVEEFPYATGKGIISVSALGDDGRFSTPRPVLDAPHHLSYPQIIEADGEIFMLPEGSGGGELVLYRAEAFPDRWVRDTVLVAGVRLNDATLLMRDGRYWLVGTERVDVGSSSDTMVISSAPRLRGPWTPHRRNPIVIDRRAARPGGAFIARGGRTFLPVQDGTRTYGGGLGLVELLRLTDDAVEWSPVQPIVPGPAWDREGIHTLNRAGGIEVVDSVG